MRTDIHIGGLALAALGTLVLGIPEARAVPSFYDSNCAGCHGAVTATNPGTCNGCHSHGTHTQIAGSDINITGITDKSSYAPGESVSVTVTGGNRSGWVRAVLFDENLNEVARSSCPGGMGGCTTSVFPATLTAPAPAVAGTYTWAVAWYGNQFDGSGASFGSGTSQAIQPGFFTPDDTNPNHGLQTVAVPAFTVAEAPSTGLDVDIGRLSVPRRVDPSRGRALSPLLVLLDPGSVGGTAAATVTASIGGTQVYSQTMQAQLAAGGRSSLRFPDFVVPADATGVIAWEATVADEDPDVDVAVAQTQIVTRNRAGGESALESGSQLLADSTSAAGAGGCSSTGGAAALTLLAPLLLLGLRRPGRARLAPGRMA